MNKKTWIIFVVICLVLLGGLVMLSRSNQVEVSSIDVNSVIEASEDSGNIGDRVYGNKDAEVVLVEYGDFQCPGCKSAHEPIKSAVEMNKDDVAFVFRNYPLTAIHPNARAAAAAAEAAGEEGKFWEMHDELYENQDAWSGASADERTTIFTDYAVSIGLDASKFTQTLDDRSNDLTRKIDFDRALGTKQKVNETPTIFLNGTKLEAEQFSSSESLDKAIKEALK